MALYVGANYHPHDWEEERWPVDIDLMKTAGFNMVRVGHLAWDSFEPDEGVYTFEWFDKVMDLFAKADIKVVLDVSMRPAPVWVHDLCPGCGIVSKSGNKQDSIRRYMEDVADPAYQHYALRFAEVLVNRYKNHPALHSFGLCNELGAGMMSFSEYARKRFINWLKKKYVTIEELNRAWATKRWCRRLRSFDDVVFPENEIAKGAPEPWLDMRRFHSDGIIDFVTKLSMVVKTLAPHLPYSTNLYPDAASLGYDYLKKPEEFMDYPGMGCYPGYDPTSEWHQYFMFVAKHDVNELNKPLWFLEFQTGTEGICCGPKGFMRMQMMLGLLNRGQMFLGWTWRTMYAGEEQYYFGILGHDGYPTHNYTEYKQIAADMKKLESYGFPYVPMPEVGVAFSQESEWINRYHRGHFRQKYMDNILEVQRAFYAMNLEYNIVNIRNLKNSYKLLVVPGHIILEPSASKTIREFVAEGGTVIMTGYSASADENAQAFRVPKPGTLADVFGVRVAAFYRTDIEGFFEEDAVTRMHNGKARELLKVSGLGEEFYADIDYYEELELGEAKPYAMFADKDMCAVSVNEYGKGKAYYVAAETNEKMLGMLVEKIAPEAGVQMGLKLPLGVQGRRIAEGQYFYVNTNNREEIITLPARGKGVLSGLVCEKELRLKPYDCELMVCD